MQRLDLLVHLAQFSDRILVITGPAGAGKTSVLQQFMSRAGEGWRPCAMDSTEVPHRNALLARLASCFGGAGKADSTAVDVPALIERWRALQSAGRHPMVVIDDAHKLNGGTLEALLNLAGDPAQTAARVRLILLGEEPLLAQLARAGLDPDAVLTTDDLVAGDNCFFAATGITDGELLKGVRFSRRGASTQSLVMRSKSGTVRQVNASHRLSKLAGFSSIDFA